jgi:hypothetical protein
MFLCGGAPNTKMELLGVLGYREGKLPVRYLGVPFNTSKLSAYDCSILVDRIMAKARSWLNRHLSYLGRLQLLNSILFSIHVYWSGLYILPKAVMEKITSSCGRVVIFLMVMQKLHGILYVCLRRKGV